jgi:LmbE family N-acetylglucosaminyl deacetylase
VKILCAHAHFDDFEFVASGLFEMWRRHLGNDLRARVMVCTDGKAGHHFRTREETGRIRLEEQKASARFGKYEFEPLLLPDGSPPREACLQVTPALMAALWKSIRAFEPDYLFCPPVAADALAGIHVDHVAVADAIRKTAYMINVPHAFTPEFPSDETKPEPRKTPVIINVHDSYMAGENAFDLAVDVEEAFEAMSEMAFCHRSQIAEWIPWVGRHDMAPPKTIEEWQAILRRRCLKRNREMGIQSNRVFEFYTVTAWGQVPALDDLLRDIPNVVAEFSQLDALEKRLRRWRGDESI